MASLIRVAEAGKDISTVEQMKEWAKQRQAQAEQLAQDATRLLGCTTDRLDRLRKQNFFIRCWSRFNGDTASAERATTKDILRMQNIAFQYINMLQEEQILTAHSLLTIKNNLLSLSVKERETRELIVKLADRTRERFERLEDRVDQLEISSNIHSWIICLDERDYDKKYPTPLFRLLQIINDFYNIKKGNWNYSDILILRKAIRIVGMEPTKTISLLTFIHDLIDEIQNPHIGFELFGKMVERFSPTGIDDYSSFVVGNISSPIFFAIHALRTEYRDKAEVIELIRDRLTCDEPTALKELLVGIIKNMNVNLGYEIAISEASAEVLNCISLVARLYDSSQNLDSGDAGESSNNEYMPDNYNNFVSIFLNSASHSQNKIYVSGENNSDFIISKLKNFINKNEFNISIDDVIIFDSGQSDLFGFALTNDTLYINSANQANPCALEISTIIKESINDSPNGLKMIVNGKTYYVRCSDRNIAGALARCLIRWVN